MIFTNQQKEVFEKKLSANYLQKIINRLHNGFPNLVEKAGDQLQFYMSSILNLSRKWGLTNDDDIVRLSYLLLSYETKNIAKPDLEIVKLMTWPNRNPDDKLDYLHHYLIKKHYGTISTGKE